MCHLDTKKFMRGRMSWPFIGVAALFILIWITMNLIPGLPHFDPYDIHGSKFEILNLLMSVEQVLSNPIIFMALFAEMMVDRHTNTEVLRSVDALLKETRGLIASLSDLGEDIDEIGDRVEEVKEIFDSDQTND
jgi:uncharacterized membrane protein